MARTRNNNLRVLLFSAIAAVCVLVLDPSASEAHSSHNNLTAFENAGTAARKSYHLNHHPLEPCPHNHSADTPVAQIAKECGGNPSGTVPGSGFSKETVMEAIPHNLHSALDEQNLFAFLPLYPSFMPDPFERPPQSL